MKSNSAVTEKKKKEKKQKTYQQYIFYKVIVIIILIVVLLAITIFAIHAGSSGISVWDVIKTIFGAGTKQTNSIVFGIRLPRVVTALIAGMALGMVGCVMQSVLRNPLADASTLGVSQGAAFGATVAIICFGAGAQNTASAANAVMLMDSIMVIAIRTAINLDTNFFMFLFSLSFDFLLVRWGFFQHLRWKFPTQPYLSHDSAPPFLHRLFPFPSTSGIKQER